MQKILPFYFYSKYKNIALSIAAIILFAASVSAILLGCYYTWPDLECINESRAKYVGFWTAWTQLMVSMDGRYATNFLHSINPMVWAPMQVYKLMPLLGMGLFTVALLLFFSAILATTRQALLLALLFVALHFAVSPSLAFELFSLVFSFMYLWGVSFWLLWVGAFIQYCTAPVGGKKYGWLALAVFFLLFSYGINEMFLVVNTISIVVILFFAYASRQLAALLPLAMVGVLAIVFFFALSGSIQRVSFEAGFHNYKHLPSEWKLFISHLGQAWYQLFIGGGALWLFFMPLLTLFSVKQPVNVFFKNKFFLKIIIISLLAMGTFAVIPYYIFVGTKGYFPVRVFNACFSFWQLALLLFSIIFLPRVFKNNFSIAVATCFLLFQFFYMPNNYWAIIAEWRDGKYHLFNENFATMHYTLQQAATSDATYKTAFINPVPDKNLIIYTPSTFWQGNEWNRQVLEGYYGIDEICFTNDTTSKYHYLYKTLCKP